MNDTVAAFGGGEMLDHVLRSIKDGVPYHRDMMCGVLDIGYDFVKRWGRVVTAKHHCTDMEGCIAVFLRIDPKVQRITVADDEDLANARAIVYERTSAGSWSANEVDFRA